MMNSVYCTFLKLLLATSLAVTPVSGALAAMDSGSAQPVQDAAAEPCHQSGHEQTATDTPEIIPMMAPCGCCDDDCSCADDSACRHEMASPVLALPTELTANHTMAQRIFIAALPYTYNSVRSPPDTPPPNA